MTNGDCDIRTDDTLPKLLLRRYQQQGEKLVIREKEYGIWQAYAWKHCYEKTEYLSLGLLSLGLERGDKVAILGDTKPESYYVELAVQAAGGTLVGIFADCTPAEVEYYLTHSDSRFVFAQDQEQVDKLLRIHHNLPLVVKVIYWEMKGLWNYDHPLLMKLDKLLDLGKEYEISHSGLFEQNIEIGKADDVALLVYTSGTTGLPKAVMMSQANLCLPAKLFGASNNINSRDNYVSIASIAWVGEQLFGIGTMLSTGMTVNFPETPETAQENIRETNASVIFYGSRLWESINRTIQSKMTGSRPLNRFFSNILSPVGYKLADIRLAHKKPSLFWRFLGNLDYIMLVRPLADKLGLLHKKIAYTGGSAISPDTMRLFAALRVNIQQFYGSSEAGLVSGHRVDDTKFETCGPPLPGNKIRISKEGEILFKGSTPFIGYYKDSEASAKIADAGGWLHTGDFGHVDVDGHLIVIDRMSDLTSLADGTKFSPQYAEARLRFSPYIRDALVIGSSGYDYVSAIINIDLDNVGHWAEVNHIPYTTMSDLSQNDEVIQLIGKPILSLNSLLPTRTRIRRFANLHKDFDPDEAELTRTRKLRRSAVYERYYNLIKSIYEGNSQIKLRSSVIYQDGREGILEHVVKINSLD